MSKNYGFKIIMLLIILLVCMVFAVTLGAVRIPVGETVSIIGSKLGIIGLKIDMNKVKESNIFIVLNIRLPRIILASLVGAILALVGASYQAIFKNPMADPFVMGVSSGAAFGATIAIVLGLNKGLMGFGFTSIAAFGGALATTAIVYQLAKIGHKISTTSILLAGIVMSSLLSSGISILMIFNQDDLANIIAWTMGSFNGANWNQVIIILIPVLLGLLFLTSLAREMNAIVMGEEDAQNMGVNVELIKKLILVTASLLSALAVSVSGIIGFAGIIVPHLFRIIFGSDHKIVLPVSAIGGGIFLLICDTLARTLIPGRELPVGVITSVIGGPFFLYLLKRARSKTMM